MPRNPGNSSESTVFTCSGRRVGLEAPHPTSILASDLAEHLSKQAMFRGATRGLYTAAQHCAIVAGEMAREEGATAALYGLLHHAANSYSDDPRHAPALREAVYRAFGLPLPAPAPEIAPLQRIHDCVELTELKQLCSGCEPEIARLERAGAVPLKSLIRPLGWDRAHDRFVEALRTYAKVAGLPRQPAFGDLL